MLPLQQKEKTMRRYIPTLTLLLTTLATALLLHGETKAQRFKNQQVAVIEFDFSLHPLIRKKMIPYEGLYPELPPNVKGGDEVFWHLKSFCFELLKSQLESEIGMIVMPLNSYGKRFSYDRYGFPTMNIERAQRRGDARYYLKIKMDIQASPESTVTLGRIEGLETDLKPEDYLRPNIKIDLIFYRRTGVVPFRQYSTSTQWQTPILLQPRMLDGIVNSQVQYDRSTLREAIMLGIVGVVDEI